MVLESTIKKQLQSSVNSYTTKETLLVMDLRRPSLWESNNTVSNNVGQIKESNNKYILMFLM